MRKAILPIVVAAIAILLLIPVVVVPDLGKILAGNNPQTVDCNVPPFIGIKPKPNFLMVLDMSGSMQWMTSTGGGNGYYSYKPGGATYKASGASRSNVARQNWSQTAKYYGMFDEDKFYEYIEPVVGTHNGYFQVRAEETGVCGPETPPEYTVVGVGKRVDQDKFKNTMCFIVTDPHQNDGNPDPEADPPEVDQRLKAKIHNNDYVWVDGLTKYTHFNNRWFKVKFAGKSNYFQLGGLNKNYIRVEVPATEYEDFSPDGIPPATDIGSPVTITRRAYAEPGSFAENCISGHLLNWASTSRIDAALRAITGGKGELVEGDTRFERRAQGMQKPVYDNSELKAYFYRRPGKYFDNAHHPDHFRFGTYSQKDIYLTVANYAAGSIRFGSQDPPIIGVFRTSDTNRYIYLATGIKVPAQDPVHIDPRTAFKAGQKVDFSGLDSTPHGGVSYLNDARDLNSVSSTTVGGTTYWYVRIRIESGDPDLDWANFKVATPAVNTFYSVTAGAKVEQKEDLKIERPQDPDENKYADIWAFQVTADNTPVKIYMERAALDPNNDTYDGKLRLYKLADLPGTCKPSDASWPECLATSLRAGHGVLRDSDTNLHLHGDQLEDVTLDSRAEDRDTAIDSSDDNAPVGCKDPAIDTTLHEGRYLVVVVSNNTPTDLPDPYGYFLLTNDDIKLYEVPHARRNAVGPSIYSESSMSTMGTIFDAYLRHRTEPESGSGFLQKTYSFVNYGLMYYNGGKKGKMLAGCGQKPVQDLVDYLHGQDPYSVDDPDFIPTSNTPTGPALEEAWDYFAQDNVHDSNYNNEDFILQPGHHPFKGDWGGRPNVEIPCRKSVILLISDGEYNQGVDPVEPAYSMNTTDVAPTIGTNDPLFEKQNVRTYSIFAFGTGQGGKRSLKTVSMFGAFRDQPETNDAACWNSSGIGWPYPYTTYPATSSKQVTYPIAECDPESGTYDTNRKCCSEWDAADSVNPETDEAVRGLPDTYYEVSHGSELENAMQAILREVLQGAASAGAVATVSQEVVGGDVIVRAAFDAVDLSQPGRYTWWGHIESYWPFLHDGVFKHDFQVPCNKGLLCHDVPGAGGDCPSSAHCWDSAEVMQYWLNDGDNYNDRRIFTAKHTWDGNNPVLTSPYERMWLAVADELDDTASDYVSSTTELWDGLFKLPGSDDTKLRKFVDWLRGRADIGSDDLRDRGAWMIGDVVYSTPVIVSTPPMGAVSLADSSPLDRSGVEGYQAFRTKKLMDLYSVPVADPITIDDYIKKMVYVGGNDGMLHAIVLAVWDWDNMQWVTKRTKTGGVYDSSDEYLKYVGRELWSYIPSNLLPELKDLSDPDYATELAACTPGTHRTMVDLSPDAWQVYIKPPQGGVCDMCKKDNDIRYRKPDGNCPDDYSPHQPERCWRTVLIGGERGGGDMYFAIDITDPDNPLLIWEFSVLKDMVLFEGPLSNPKVQNPAVFHDNYDDISTMPMTWTRPQVGRLRLPSDSGSKFYVGDPPGEQKPWATAKADIQLFSDDGKRHVAFVGGGFRIFRKTVDYGGADDLGSDMLNLLRRPHLFAIDMETGENLFRYVWPWIHLLLQDEFGADWPIQNRPKGASEENTVFKVPCTLATPLLADLWNDDFNVFGNDGFVDHIYVGDMCGYMHGIKLKGFTEGTPTNRSIFLDTWVTKSIENLEDATVSSSGWEWSNFRPSVHPIAARASVALSKGRDSNGDRKVQVIFGTGKYDNMAGGYDDRSDPAKTSLYNIADSVNLSSLAAGADDPSVDLTDIKVSLTIRSRCEITEGNGFGLDDLMDTAKRQNVFWAWDSKPLIESPVQTPCTWVKGYRWRGGEDSQEFTPDCCLKEKDECGSPCMACVYDLTYPDALPHGADTGAATPALTDGGSPAGERITSKPLIAGGLVFVTSFVPPTTPCKPLGQGYLYIFEYQCKPFPAGYNPLRDSDLVHFGISTGDPNNPDDPGVQYGTVVELGEGMPSEPVLNASGDTVIIQMSNADILKIEVDMLSKAFQLKGWQEKASGE